MNTDRIFAEQIANEYAPKDTARIVALRKLDRHAKRPALVFAYAFGIAMSLVLGVGMCLAMRVIGDGSALTMGVGIAVGTVGIARRIGQLSPLPEAAGKREAEICVRHHPARP